MLYETYYPRFQEELIKEKRFDSEILPDRGGRVLMAYLEDTESFETGFGHWPNAPGNDENWTRKSGGTSSSSTGPSSAASGSYYIYVETSSGHAYSSGDISIVEYNLVSVKDGSVDFYYHQYGSNQGRLYLEGYDGSWHTIWYSYGDHGNKWIHVTKNFSGYSKLRFRNRAAGSYRGDVALDLIRVYVTIPPEIEDYTESFETGFGYWHNAPGNKSNWRRKSGGTSSVNTGPSSAYRGSYYIYVETSSGSSYYSGDTDIIELNLVSRKKGYVDFYYHQYGVDQGYLYLEGYDGSWHTIWYSYRDHGNKWIHVTRIFDGYSKLRFRNRARGGYRGDVALDLIRVYILIPTTLTIGVSPTPPIKPGATLTFSGKLMRADTGAGIAGHTVALEQPPGTVVKSTTTNSAGNYGISVAAPTAPGVYRYRTVFEGTASLRRGESGSLGFGIAEPSLLLALASAFVGGLLIACCIKD